MLKELFAFLGKFRLITTSFFIDLYTSGEKFCIKYQRFVFVKQTCFLLRVILKVYYDQIKFSHKYFIKKIINNKFYIVI